MRSACTHLPAAAGWELAIVFLDVRPRVAPAATRPITNEPSMLEAGSVKYAPRVLCLRPGSTADLVG